MTCAQLRDASFHSEVETSHCDIIILIPIYCKRALNDYPYLLALGLRFGGSPAPHITAASIQQHSPSFIIFPHADSNEPIHDEQ